MSFEAPTVRGEDALEVGLHFVRFDLMHHGVHPEAIHQLVDVDEGLLTVSRFRVEEWNHEEALPDDSGIPRNHSQMPWPRDALSRQWLTGDM